MGEKAERLRNSGKLFQEPDSTLLLSSGCGRHWPDGRGIFTNESENFLVWVNEEDHMRIISMQKGAAIVEIFTRFSKACAQIEKVIKEEGYSFMHNDHLGYILTCPSNLGTGLRAGAMVKIPLFSARPDFKSYLSTVKLQVRGSRGVDSASKGGVWDISNSDRLGTSEVDLCNIFIEGVSNVIKWEQMLEAEAAKAAASGRRRKVGRKSDSPVDKAMHAYFLEFQARYPHYFYPPRGLSATLADVPEWIRLGCGNEEYICAEKGATFPGDRCPASLPDLGKHGNLCAQALRNNPDWYAKYKNVKTKMGVTLAKCIKTGIDNPGHPHILTCGLVAGDEESFTAFKEVFDEVISKRNGGYGADAKHPSNMDYTQLSKTPIDPTGKYVISTRCRTGRAIRGFPLPPSLNFNQRREVERLIIKGLESMTGELKGTYNGLHGSRSTDKGMTEEKAERLRNSGKLFQEPDSTLLLSSGCGRRWPDGRGIFTNESENFLVWVNEEDHNDHLGYILT